MTRAGQPGPGPLWKSAGEEQDFAGRLLWEAFFGIGGSPGTAEAGCSGGAYFCRVLTIIPSKCGIFQQLCGLHAAL